MHVCFKYERVQNARSDTDNTSALANRLGAVLSVFFYLHCNQRAVVQSLYVDLVIVFEVCDCLGLERVAAKCQCF